MKSNCKDCKERYLGCHSECESYKRYIEEWNELKEKKNKETALMCTWAKGIKESKRKRVVK